MASFGGQPDVRFLSLNATKSPKADIISLQVEIITGVNLYSLVGLNIKNCSQALNSKFDYFKRGEFKMLIKPKTFNWIGNSSDTLYWDDPENWAEGEYPNQKDAIAIFANSVRQDTSILIRKDIHFAQMWFSEKHPITFDSDPETTTPSGDQPNFFLETSNQFSTLFIDRDNKGDHVFNRHVFHSCYFYQAHRDLSLGKPIPPDTHITTLHYNGEIGNYKDPERASLQAYGHLKVQLNAVNSFIGPVVAKYGGEIRAMKNGAIPKGTPITLEHGGNLFAGEGVLVNASELRVDGVALEAGIYRNEKNELDSFEINEMKHLSDRELEKSKKMTTKPLSNIKGKGSIIVGL